MAQEKCKNIIDMQGIETVGGRLGYYAPSTAFIWCTFQQKWPECELNYHIHAVQGTFWLHLYAGFHARKILSGVVRLKVETFSSVWFDHMIHLADQFSQVEVFK